MKNLAAIVFFLLLGGVSAAPFRSSTTSTPTECSKDKISWYPRGGSTATKKKKLPGGSVKPPQPLLRGEFHRFGALLYPPLLGVPLYVRAKPAYKQDTLVFSLAVEGIMAVSATLHTLDWRHESLYLLARKADFAMIFVGIALFYSSIGKLMLGNASSLFATVIEPLVWTCAAIGVLAKGLAPEAAPWFNAAIFLVQGWAMGPLVPTLFRTATLPEAVGLFLGGIFITLGATAYSVRWPNGHYPFLPPDIFGPHEMFHIGTLFMFVSFWFTMWMRVAR